MTWISLEVGRSSALYQNILAQMYNAYLIKRGLLQALWLQIATLENTFYLIDLVSPFTWNGIIAANLCLNWMHMFLHY